MAVTLGRMQDAQTHILLTIYTETERGGTWYYDSIISTKLGLLPNCSSILASPDESCSSHQWTHTCPHRGFENNAKDSWKNHLKHTNIFPNWNEILSCCFLSYSFFFCRASLFYCVYLPSKDHREIHSHISARLQLFFQRVACFLLHVSKVT